MRFFTSAVRAAVQRRSSKLVSGELRRLASETSAVASAAGSDRPTEAENVDALASGVDDQDDAAAAAQAQERVYEQRKDVSQLKPFDRALVHGEAPPLMFEWQRERASLRRRFALFGRASGVDPATAQFWPTREELADASADERERQPFADDLRAAMELVRKRKLERQRAIDARVKQVNENIRKYPKQLEDYKNRLREQQEAANAFLQKKQEKVREIQEFFGYPVDADDPRFQALMLRKEEEERKAEKAAKKQERRDKLIAQVLSPSVGGGDDEKAEANSPVQ